MPASEKMLGEDYRLNQRLKFYIVGIKESAKGQDIIISRSHKGLVEGLFKLEVPEIGSGIVEIKAIAREAGQRTKAAVSSKQAGVDPVGSCVGQKGVRVQAVIAELGVEKIDVIAYSDDPAKFVASALSPAKVEKVRVDAEDKIAYVSVPEDQLSLAIGKDGQNVRLAAKLTGWKVDIKGAGGLGGAETLKDKVDTKESEGAVAKPGKKKTLAKKGAKKQEKEEETKETKTKGKKATTKKRKESTKAVREK